MLKQATVAVISLGCSIAQADDVHHRGSLGVGVMVGADDNTLEGAIAFEGTLALTPNAPVYGHAVGAIGSLGLSGRGEFEHGRVGVEVRSCTGVGRACLLADLDVGYQSQTWDGQTDFGDKATEHHSGLVAGPTVGIDAGGDRTRFRATLDMLEFHDGEKDKWMSSVNVTMGVAFRLD